MPLEFVKVFGEPSVMDTLFAVEESYPSLGKSILPILFPGVLADAEQVKWNSYDVIKKLNKSKDKKKQK